jgi:pectin methylesterase-like acyl-CoA thioesterase
MMIKIAKPIVVLIVTLISSIAIGTAASVFAAPSRVCDVCPTGCTYSSIQNAINAATSGDEIEVCDGTYLENIDFLGKNISVISRNGPASTVIDGNLNGAVVTFAGSEGPGAVLSGFTLQNGSGYYTGFSYGGGIYIEGASPTITQCEIIENNAVYGSGIYLNSSSASITDCVFRVNSNSLYDGAGIYCTSSSPTILGKEW